MTKSRDTISYSPYTLGLLALIGLGLVGYLYFLNLSVVHVVIRTEVMLDLQDTKNQIALLETEYISAQHTITATMAKVSKFQEDQTKVFVMRGATPNLVLGQ
jgi:predicted ribosome-associated RNA-binding protein Tma20